MDRDIHVELIKLLISRSTREPILGGLISGWFLDSEMAIGLQK